jgi:lysozyme
VLEHLHHFLAALGAAALAFGVVLTRKPAADVVPLAVPKPNCLTPRALMELIGHEAIVCEAYKDSRGIWTWGIGVTSASGHHVERYIDKPQPVERCIEIFIWLLQTKYLPAVLKAFAGYDLDEAQLAAAVSFHYNTGKIAVAQWVKDWKQGKLEAARADFMLWRTPRAVTERRQAECDLFFDGKWSNDGKALIVPVNKPSHQPNFRQAKRVNVMPLLDKLCVTP